MIISINKKIFSDAVASVAKFAERRVLALPALSGIAITAENDSIVLRATNLETGIEMKVEGTVRKPGAVAVPASVLRDISSSFSGDGVVTLEVSGETVALTTEKGKGVIKTLPYDDVPTLGVPEEAKTKCTLPGASFKALIGSVSAYASSSTVRPELASILLSSEGGVLKAVATDSFRLAEKKLSIAGTLSPFSLLIPAKNASDIVQNIPDSDIELSANEHQCAVSWSGVVAVTRLVAMSYPDYQQIIPKSFVSEATVLKKDLETALKRVAVFSDSFQKVRLGIDPKKKTLSLSAQNSDVGEASEDVAASASGDGIELSFNHRYLSAPLPSISSESISLSASGIGRPLVLRPQGDASFLYLVMPMNQ